MLKKELIQENKHYKDKCKVLSDALKDKINELKMTDHALYGFMFLMGALVWGMNLDDATGTERIFVITTMLGFLFTSLWIIGKGFFIRYIFIKEKKKTYSIVEKLKNAQKHTDIRRCLLNVSAILVLAISLLIVVSCYKLDAVYELTLVCTSGFVILLGCVYMFVYAYQQYKIKDEKDKELMELIEC